MTQHGDLIQNHIKRITPIPLLPHLQSKNLPLKARKQLADNVANI